MPQPGRGPELRYVQQVRETEVEEYEGQGEEGELGASCNIVSVRSWRGVRARGGTFCTEPAHRDTGRDQAGKSCNERRYGHLEDAAIHKSTPRRHGPHPGAHGRSHPVRRQPRWPRGSVATAEKPCNPDVARGAAVLDEPVQTAVCARPFHFIPANDHFVNEVVFRMAIRLVISVLAAVLPSARLHVITWGRKVCQGHGSRPACRVGDRTSQALHRSCRHIRRGESYSGKQEQGR